MQTVKPLDPFALAAARIHPTPWRLLDPNQDAGGVTVVDAKDNPVAVFDDADLATDKRQAERLVTWANQVTGSFAWHGAHQPDVPLSELAS